MTFSLTLKCDNEAFTEEPGLEVARILRVVASKLEVGGDGGACMDANGNRVGAWALEDEVQP